MKKGDKIMVTDSLGKKLEGIFVRKYRVGKGKLGIFQVTVQGGPLDGKVDWHLLEERVAS